MTHQSYVVILGQSVKLYCFYLPISLFVCRLPCPTHYSIFSLLSGTMLPIVCSLKFCRIFKGRLLQYNETQRHMTFQPLKFKEGTFYMCSLCCHFKPSSTLTILLLLACTCCFVPVAMKRETCVRSIGPARRVGVQVIETGLVIFTTGFHITYVIVM